MHCDADDVFEGIHSYLHVPKRLPIGHVCNSQWPGGRLRSSEKLRWQVGALSAFHHPPVHHSLMSFKTPFSCKLCTLNSPTESLCVAFPCVFGIWFLSEQGGIWGKVICPCSDENCRLLSENVRRGGEIRQRGGEFWGRGWGCAKKGGWCLQYIV